MDYDRINLLENNVFQKLCTVLKINLFEKWNIPFFIAESDSYDKFIDIEN